MPNELMRMRPQAPSEQSPMPEMAPVSESDWLAQMVRPQAPQPAPGTLAAYISNMRASDPAAMPAPQAATPVMSNIPSLADILAFFQGGVQKDQDIYQRLGPQVGAMSMNNQMHRQRLDDMDRERARDQMMLNQLQGMR